MKHEVRLSKRALRELESLDFAVRNRITSKLDELAENPFPRGTVKLQGRDGTFRVRVGDYRVLYEVLGNERMILVDKVDHRSGAYGP